MSFNGMMFKKTPSAKFFRTALAAAGFALLSVVFGAYMRMSDAALGCADGWDCVGGAHAPMTARDYRASIAPATALPAQKRAWKEVVMRYIAGALGLLLIRLAVLGWRLKKYKPSQQVLIPASALVLVFGLTIAGLLTIEWQFKPLILMMQLLGGMAVLGLLWWIVLREQRIFRSVARTPLTRRLRPRVLVALGIVVAQIALGGWSMVNYAGLACPDFPTCQNEYWPPADFIDGFTLWRDVGPTYESELLSLQAATAIHMAHRVGALITVLYVGWLALHLLRVGFQESLCRYGLLLLVVLSCAAALGITEAVARLPLAAGVAHNAVAALLLMSLVTLYHVVRTPRNA